MVKRFIPFVILTMGFLLVSVSWAADGDNDFIFAYSHADGDPFANSMVRGACAGSDLDQDGLYEIIITDYDSSGMVHVYEVVGDNSITHVWSSAGSQETSNCRQVHTGDMDNDGIGEIIFIPGDGTWSATYEGGIHVYEWDGMTDNGYGTAAASIYKPNAANQNRFRAEGFDIGDVDGDGENELMIVDNTTVNANDGLFILSVDGDFQGVHTWVEEGVFLRSGPNVFGGSPINARMGNMDGDAYNEAIFGIWDYAAIYVVEATGPDAYAFQVYLSCDTTGDGVNLDNFEVADLNGDGADEVYFNIYGGGEMACITGGADVSTITFAGNVNYIAPTGGTGAYGMGLGDQDHGWPGGSDGMDLYVAAYSNGVVYDHELTGADPFLEASWTKYTMVSSDATDQGAFGIAVPPVDMDKDGRREVVVTYLEPTAPPGKFFRVFEWTYDPLAVELSSFTATAGQEMVELSWRVESEIENKGFNIYRDDQLIAFVESRGATDAPRTYTWIDREVTAGVTYSYKIADVALDGTEHMHDFVATATPMAAGVPTTYWLSQNYPNPFNADTHIEFTLAKAGQTTLKIYNTTGQLVRTLVDEHMTASRHKVRWDGRGENGELVASGVYFYRLASGTFAETKKMTFLR